MSLPPPTPQYGTTADLAAISGVELLISYSVPTPVASVTFNLPASVTGRHLWLLASVQGDDAGTGNGGMAVIFNNDGGANYDYTYSSQLGASAPGQGEALATTASYVGMTPQASSEIGGAGTNRNFALNDIRVAEYQSADRHKRLESQCVAHTYTGSVDRQQMFFGAGCWRSTAAITIVSFLSGAGNFVVGSTFTILAIP